MRVTANGRGDWIGWLALKREAVNEDATRNTARVVADIAADVLAVVEAEDRPALQRFNEDVLPFGYAQGTPAWRYRHVILIDGNDDRGIDVGLLTRDQFPITRMRSHVDDLAPNGEGLFSRDCPEYELALPGGKSLLVLVHHFKSKGHGTQASNNARRLAQATRVAEIYNSRRADGWKRVAVVGDLNDTRDSAPLDPLPNGTDLKDVSKDPAYIQDGRTHRHLQDQQRQARLPTAIARTAGRGDTSRAQPQRRLARPEGQEPVAQCSTRSTSEEQAASDHAEIWGRLTL